MCALLDPEVRQWLDIVAQYLTAVGTVGAVIVALYLSRKDRREKISVSAAIHYSVGPEQTFADSTRLFGLTATNVGFATVTVQNICWRVGVFRKTVLYVNTFGLPTERPPKTLRRGDWLIVRESEEQFIDGLTFLLEEVSKHPFPTLALRSLRAGVETSTKKRFFARPNWDVAKILREQFDTFRKITQARSSSENARP
jgi:hypothetical protein